jgi:hypothetical protein
MIVRGKVFFSLYLSINCLGLDPELVLQTQFSSISFDSNEILDMLRSCDKQEPVDYEQPSQQLQSSFIEHYDPTVFYPSQPGMFSDFSITLIESNIYYILAYPSVPLLSVGSSPIEPKIEDGMRYMTKFNNIDFI